MPASDFDALDGFAQDDALAAFRVFRAHGESLVAGAPPLRAALPAPPGLIEAARAALSEDIADADSARAFFAAHFEPRAIGRGFLTGYYEPWVEGALAASTQFQAPLLARPADLGARVPYPTRAEIEGEMRDPVVWLRDAVETYLIQVQGSARVRLPDGTQRRLIYDGRNALPYTSIGRLLIESGEIAPAEMSLARLKAWLRAAPERGRALMQRNESFVFFRLAPDVGDGPIGGAGLPLTPLRSLAVDRGLWSYGLPFFVRADIPWRSDNAEPFGRLMIAQDTGTAIVGPGRADLFFGGGEAAGTRAGSIRHEADMFVLWPRGERL
jgi:membrane-bound lytic murein transglycosylase A